MINSSVTPTTGLSFKKETKEKGQKANVIVTLTSLSNVSLGK